MEGSFEDLLERAGIQDFRFHDLRHTFASWALAECGDLKLVQEALGHKHITTTARYAHLLTGRREAVVGAVAEKLTGSAGVATPKLMRAGEQKGR